MEEEMSGYWIGCDSWLLLALIVVGIELELDVDE